MSNYEILFSFYNELKKFNNLNPRKGCTKEETTIYNNVKELYNEYLEIYFDQYMTLPDAKKTKPGDKYDPKILFFLMTIIMITG